MRKTFRCSAPKCAERWTTDFAEAWLRTGLPWYCASHMDLQVDTREPYQGAWADEELHDYNYGLTE
jgi:hypothetical protein